MSRLIRVIAPKLRKSGLDVREFAREGNEVRELVVTNPRFPSWGRIVVDREGLLSWERWGHIETDSGASEIADVITGLLASGEDDTAERYGKLVNLPSLEESRRPHP